MSDQVQDGFNDIQDSLVTLQTELTDLITGQLGEVRQQALMGALARSESALDLLSSIDAGLPVDAGLIIAEASLGLRDVLAQATTIATRTATYTPDIGDISVAVAAVGVALAARAQVAVALENDIIGSSAMNEQFRDAADFLRDSVQHYRDTMYLDREFQTGFSNELPIYTLGTLNLPNASAFDWFDPDSGESGNPLEINVFTTSAFDGTLTFPRTNFDLDTMQEILFDAPGSPFEGRFAELVSVSSSGNWTIHASDPLGDRREVAYQIAEYDAETIALGLVGAGSAGSIFFQLADNFDSLADGDEQVLSAPAGQDPSGMLTGDLDGPGKDLLIGNIGDDVLNGLDGNDILRGNEGDDTLNGGLGEDRLEGGPGNDDLFGGVDGDELFGAEGDDLLDGGTGFDKAGFRGKRADYTIDHGNFGFRNGVSFDVVKVEGPDGSDILRSVERLFFKDSILTLGISEQIESTLSGAEGSDLLWHYGAGGTLSGAAGNDELIGRGANQTYVGGLGNDVMKVETTAPSLNDVAVFSGNRSAYAITMPGTETLRVVGLDGTDSLSLGFDRLQFADLSVNLFYGTGAGGVAGTANADILFDMAGDAIAAGAGNDLIVSQQPDAAPLTAILDGGAGIDTLRLPGALADHTVRFATGIGGELIAIRGPEGTRLTQGMETVQFDAITGEATEQTSLSIRYGTAARDDIFGFEGQAIVVGGADNDLIDMQRITLFGPVRPNDFSVFLSGGGGNDTLLGGTNNDVLDGGTGQDLLVGGAGYDTAVLTGGPSDWTFSINGLAVVATGLPGTMAAASGTKNLLSIEYLEFQTSAGELIASNELVLASSDGATSSESELIFLINENLAVSAGGGADTVVGSEGVDTVAGDSGNDVIDGGGGNDNLDGGAGDDDVNGGSGNDVVTGAAGSDRLTGGTGRDAFVFQLSGQRQFDTIVDFQSGTDRIFVDTLFYNTAISGQDLLLDFGGGEILMLEGLALTTLLPGDITLNRPGAISPTEWLGAVYLGGRGNDSILGTNSEDTLIGGAGNDVLLGGAGADLLDGGNGIDRAQYTDATAGVVADLQYADRNTGFAAGDTYVSIEHLYGSLHNDNLRGDADNNVLWGHKGYDRLYGRDGNDVLLGGAGADLLDGGNGIDRAQYTD
ncbi:calcium-binding protein, partial [Sulfitobacter sp.]|uniref:calcium-binding protein n=1 Tax=Sulfitobacter sp. TaxID=1903071 RepID=UPI003002998A